MATTEQFGALFDPKGVVVAGASTHPGKFGFVALHNILANGYAGRVFATNREAAPVLGVDTVPSLDDIPAGEAELAFVCTPAATNADVLRAAARELLSAATPADGDVQVLVAPMLRGNRELIAGLSEDPQFGMTVMVGIGGIFAEALADVAIRLVPIERVDADEMIDELRTQALLGPFRGEPPVDRERLAEALLGLSRAATATPELVSADLNPLIVVAGVPIAVDALVEVRA